MPSLLPDQAPSSLAEAVSARGGTVAKWWREGHRTYLNLDTPSGPLFARYSLDPADEAAFIHEARVRDVVNKGGRLRAPQVEATGPGWMIEQRVIPDPVGGPQWVDAAVRAAIAIPDAGVPLVASPPSAGGAWLRRLRLVVRAAPSPIPLKDLLASRRVFAACALPWRPAHGDFHPGNVLVTGGEALVIDWELAGEQPLGYDLMQLAAAMPDQADAERVLDAAVSWLGEEHRADLLRLRYVATIRTLTAKLLPDRAFDYDADGAQRLLATLPEVRKAAGA